MASIFNFDAYKKFDMLVEQDQLTILENYNDLQTEHEITWSPRSQIVTSNNEITVD